ncbi:MAG: Wzy polymerase domain-containing protein [Ramlibacter sp.]
MNLDHRASLDVRTPVVMVCLLVPWLNPFAPGPSASVMPWLVSVFCAVIAWALIREGDAQAAPGHWTRLVAASWLAAALASSVIGLIQYFSLAAHFSPLVSSTSTGEAFANLRQRNQFASLTAIGVAAMLWWAPRITNRWAVAGMVLLAVGNAASASRTGLLQLVMLTLFTAIWGGPERRRRLALCLAAGAAYVVAALLLPLLLNAATGVIPDTVWVRLTRGDGCSSRAVLWSNVIDLTLQKPWLGWGWGELDYAHYMTLYPGERFCDILDNAHNLPLHLGVELGIPAALVICGVFLWAVVRARPWREADPTRQLAWSVMAVILLHSMLEYPLWYGPFQIAFVACIAFLWLAPVTAASPAQAHWQRAALRRLMVAVLLITTCYAAWDYRRISQLYLAPEARVPAYRDDTIDKVKGSRLFRAQVDFAELTTTPLSRDNAQWTLDTALALLHFSPEPRVIEKAIESAVMLGRDDVALAQLARYRAAFAADHRRWAAGIGCAAPDARGAAGCAPVKN